MECRACQATTILRVCRGFILTWQKKSSADVGVTKRLSDFIIRNADRNSGIFCTAAKLLERYKTDTRFIVHGYPDYDPESLKIWDYNPATYPAYLPLPAYFADSTKNDALAENAKMLEQCKAHNARCILIDDEHCIGIAL